MANLLQLFPAANLLHLRLATHIMLASFGVTMLKQLNPHCP